MADQQQEIADILPTRRQKIRVSAAEFRSGVLGALLDLLATQNIKNPGGLTLDELRSGAIMQILQKQPIEIELGERGDIHIFD